MNKCNEKIGRYIIHYHDVSELQTILSIRRIMSEWYSSTKDTGSLKDFFNNWMAITSKHDHSFLLKDIVDGEQLIGLEICWINSVRTDEEPFVTVEDIDLKKCE